MLLKARRFGGSTWVQGRYYSKTTLNTNRNAFIVAHDRESTNTIFEMAKLMHQRNPLPPMTLHNNEKSLKFDKPNGGGIKSEYRIASADNTSSGRAQGVHFLHASEEAFWRDGETLLKGLMQTIPDPPAYSEVVRESTAQGYGNSFQVDCFVAYGEGQHPYYSAKLKDVAPHMPDSNILFHFAYKAPGQDWVLVFIPWFMHHRYVKEFDTAQQKLDFATRLAKRCLIMSNSVGLSPKRLNYGAGMGLRLNNCTGENGRSTTSAVATSGLSVKNTLQLLRRLSFLQAQMSILKSCVTTSRPVVKNP